MSEIFKSLEKQETEDKENAVRKYEYAGYQIRVHFVGEKTFAECLKHLAERRIEI